MIEVKELKKINSKVIRENKKLKLELSRIVDSLDGIIKNSDGSCLCGHGEWCEECSPNSTKKKITKRIIDLRKSIKKIKQ